MRRQGNEENERNYYKINLTNGEEIIIVQIAGLVAGRMVVKLNKVKILNKVKE